MIKNSQQHELIKVKYADCEKCIIVICKLGTQTYLMANIYGPNDDDPNFFHTLANHLESFHNDQTIMGGYCNFVIDPKVASFNYVREYNTNAKQVFLNFKNDNTIVDIWRLKNPNRLEYTWSINDSLKCGRLDMLFVNAQFISSVCDVIIKP